MAPNYPHLLVNHLPLYLFLFGWVLLVVHMIRNNTTVRTVALVTLVLGGLAILPAYFSGEEAEHTVEEMAGVSHDLIEEHEELAEIALPAHLVAGALALLALLVRGRWIRFRRFADLLVLITVLIGLFFTMITAHHGGQIRRPELQDEAHSTPALQDYDDD